VISLKNAVQDGVDVAFDSNGDLAVIHLQQTKISFSKQFAGAATINGAVLGQSVHNRTAALRFAPSPELTNEDIQAFINGQWTSLTKANIKSVNSLNTVRDCSALGCNSNVPTITALSSFSTGSDLFIFYSSDSGSFATICSNCGSPQETFNVIFTTTASYVTGVLTPGTSQGYIMYSSGTQVSFLRCDFTSLSTLCPAGIANGCCTLANTNTLISPQYPPRVTVTADGHIHYLYNSLSSFSYSYTACTDNGSTFSCSNTNLSPGNFHTNNNYYYGSMDGISNVDSIDGFVFGAVVTPRSGGSTPKLILWYCPSSGSVLNSCTPNTQQTLPSPSAVTTSSGFSGFGISNVNGGAIVALGYFGVNDGSHLPWGVYYYTCTNSLCQTPISTRLVDSRLLDQTGDQIPFALSVQLSSSGLPLIGFSYGIVSRLVSSVANPILFFACENVNCDTASVVRTDTHLATNNGVFASTNIRTTYLVITTPNWGVNDFNSVVQAFGTNNVNPAGTACTPTANGKIVLLNDSPYVCSNFNVPGATSIWAWEAVVDGNLHNHFSVPTYITPSS